MEITFEFDSVRNFSALHIYTNNFFTKDTQVRSSFLSSPFTMLFFILLPLLPASPASRRNAPALLQARLTNERC